MLVLARAKIFNKLEEDKLKSEFERLISDLVSRQAKPAFLERVLKEKEKIVSSKRTTKESVFSQSYLEINFTN